MQIMGHMRNVILYYITLPLLFVLIHIGYVRFPSLHYDELMWVGPTVKAANSLFIYDTVFGQPLMLMEYIGALKVYFYRLIFLFFPPSYESARLPMLIVAGLGAAAITHSIHLVMGRKQALLMAILLTASPAVWLHAHIDLGPSTFEFFFRSCSILFTIYVLSSKNKIWPLLLCATIVLGLWNKATFIWHINAVIAALVLGYFFRRGKPDGYWRAFYLRDIFEVIRNNSRLVFCFLISYVQFGFLFFSYLRNAQTLPSDNSYLDKLGTIFKTFAGTAFFDFGWSDAPTVFTMILGWLVLLPVILSSLSVVISLAFPKRRAEIVPENLNVEFVTCCYLVLIVTQLLLVRDANKPWHAFTLLPVGFISYLYGVERVSYYFKIFSHRINAILISIIVILLFVGMHSFILIQLRRVQADTRSWDRILNSSAFDSLYSFLGSHQGQIVFLDWGFQNPAIFFNRKQKDDYYDFTQEAVNGDIEGVLKRANMNTLFVTHGEHTSAFLQGRTNLISYVTRTSMGLCKLRTFSDGDGLVVAEVWKVCE